jgi:hypothetical protein
MARIKMVAETGAAPETVAKELETLNNIKGLAKLLTKSQQKGVPLTKAEKARLEAESGFGSLIIPETGEVRIRFNETLSFNPKTIAEDARRVAMLRITPWI